MYLKSLTLRGFKTFADKTDIEFGAIGGVTAIVGPNGCGKSNILDAMRWVLGEQSTKALRAEALSQVVFAGSSERKPLSMAEVTLLIDNSDSVLKTDYSEVSIKRRVFREGESEFSLNKEDCRLKDIRDLFLDTGLGAGAYSIINQGQVDAVLSSKPEDRRQIFEEAAGINKYRFRKMAAERKLISAEQNLLRVNDLKREIAEHASALSEQAQKALEYRTLQDKLKELEIGLAKKQLASFVEKKKNLEEKIANLKQQINELSNKNRELDQKRLEVRGQLREIESKEREFQKKLQNETGSHLREELFGLEQDISSTRNTLRDQEEAERLAGFEIQRDEEYIQKFSSRKQEAEQSLSDIAAKISSMETSLADILGRLDLAQNQGQSQDESVLFDNSLGILRDLYNKIKELNDGVTSNSIDSLGVSSRIGGILQEFSQVVSQFENIVNNKSRSKQEEEELKNQEENFKVSIADNRARHERLSEEIKNLFVEAEMLSSRVNNKKNELNQIAAKKQELLNRLSEQEHKKEYLAARLAEEKEVLSKELDRLAIERDAKAKELDALEVGEHADIRDESSIREEMMRVEVATAKLEGENQGQIDRIKELYGLSLDEVMASVFEVASMSKAKTETEEARSKMRSLEPVNFLAEEEYKKSQERLSFIDSQYADLIGARENLKTLILELDNRARESFIETVKKVGQNFSDIFATLFEGGEARIDLVDEQNVFESGIEIMVRPYGKKLINLSALSGGERALTAIALLFSLLKTHPSPFCFLDEVDAALDEANVRRFLRMLKDFSETIQMIVITHNKTTMSAASTIYGITMEEPGVSKIISMKLAVAA